MFGMGFTEILVILIVAILFLGPDKLPSAMVEIAKFLRSAKNAIGSMKDSLEEEMNVKSMKDEALAYKKELLDAGDKLKDATDMKKMAAKLTSLEDDTFSSDSLFSAPKDTTNPNKPDEITLKKKESSLQDTPKIEEDKKNV
ncbi:MAG: sec-independent protein translocase protein TatB [Campylobacterota bacterium]|nr:sec-independent protein translocase protein TatB [Campylobacterota bacterium]